MAFILYQSDIDKYNPIIHWSTKNDSFIRMAMLLKKLGIKNHYFFLALLNPELENVDPFRNDLDAQTRALISLEVKLNPWYFYRECLRVPVIGGDNIPYQLSRGNLALMWGFYNDVDIAEIMPRQTGKSYGTQSIITHLIYILADNLTIGHFDKDQTNCANIIRVIKDLRDGMPSWMIEASPADIDRKESISYSKKKNTYLTFTSPIDEKGAYKLGRGSTMGIIHYDEVAFINYNWIIIPTATNAMLKASEMARKAGIPSPIIYTTTAGNPGTAAGAFALSIFEKSCFFSESLYDLNNNEELREVIRKNSVNGVLYMEFSYRQLGKTDEWFEEVSKRSNASEDDIARDLLNKWVYSSDKCVIPKELLAKIHNSIIETKYTQIYDGFILNWYLDESIVERPDFQDKVMVMGMDTSENIGRDFTTITIIDPSDVGTIATCRCNEVNLMEVAYFVLNLMLKYRNLIWIPERQSTATVIIDFVIDGLIRNKISPWKRIYNDVVQNYDEIDNTKVNIYDTTTMPVGRERASFGFRTTGGTGGTSRNILYKSTLMKTLNANYSRIRDRHIVRELSGLQTRNGRIDHATNGHDDQVISYLLACYLIYFGKCIHLYGLDSSNYLTSIDAEGKTVDKDVRQEQISIRKRIAHLEALANDDTITPVIRNKYKFELTKLKALVDDSVAIITPVAVTQAKIQQNELTTHSAHSLRSFTSRFIKAINRR